MTKVIKSLFQKLFSTTETGNSSSESENSEWNYLMQLGSL